MTSLTRRLFAVIAVLGLLLAACGDDDDDAAQDDTTQDGAGEDAPPLGPAELTAEDQSGDGTEVTVASVTLPAAGFVVIHADADGSPGPVIGHSELLPEGDSTDVAVTLDEPLTESVTVWPMAHIDANTNDAYDFDPPDVTDDAPATFEGGDVAVVPVEYTVEDAGEAGGDEAAEAAVIIEDFSFDPDSIEVDAGTTVTWTNEDGVPHTVTAGAPDEPDDTFDELVSSGESAEVTFDEAGSFAYFCSIHPNMTAEVVVS